MRNFNLAIIEGRLVKDPEIRYTQNGTALCKFSIANNNSFHKGEELQKEVNYFDVTTWSKLAERCNEYLKKGRHIIVNGRLRQNKWQDDDGLNHSKIDIIGRDVQFLYDKNSSNEAEDELSDKDAQF